MKRKIPVALLTLLAGVGLAQTSITPGASAVTSGATSTSGCVAGGVLRSISNMVDCSAGLTYASGAFTVSGAGADISVINTGSIYPAKLNLGGTAVGGFTVLQAANSQNLNINTAGFEFLNLAGKVISTGYITQPGILGELYETGGATAITMTTAGTYYPWASTTAGSSANMTVSTATDDITVTIAGKYRLNATCSMTATANAILKMRIFEEGVGQTNCSATRKIGGGGEVGEMSLSCIIASVANDSYTMQFTSDTNGDTLTPTECNLNAVYVGN